MKKQWKALLIIPILCLTLISCSSGSTDCSGLMGKICGLFPDMPQSGSMYESSGGEGSVTMSEQDACYIYTGEYGALAEWDMIEAYAVRLPDEAKVYEIHVLKVKNAGDVEAVSKLLCRRADLLAGFFVSPDQTGNIDYSAYRADVYMKGEYVFLLATPNNQSVIDLIEKSV